MTASSTATLEMLQATSRMGVLMPALLEGTFDYLAPAGTPVGALVEAPLGKRSIIGAVWDAAPPPAQKEFKLKSVTRVLEDLPPLTENYRRWLDWISEFTLAPKGAVLSLCGLSYAAKTPKKALTIPEFSITLPTLTEAQQKITDHLKDIVRSCDGRSEPERSERGGAERGNSLEPQPVRPSGRDGQIKISPTREALKPILLDGVTGSGKTEVYFHTIAEAMARGEQVLVLLPEIALTHQWFDRFEKTFGSRPTAWHSRMTPVAKARAWQAVARGEVPVVVGARSALFLPFKKLGLIIVDEEHDPSYKQEDGVLYHARDMAVVRAHFEQIPIVLASATPSLETLENVSSGKYEKLHLPERFGSAGLPSVELVDLRVHAPERGNFLSPLVRAEMLATLARGEQVLLFLNRRGYAPLLLCRACGHRFQCSHCSAWLVVHGKRSAIAGESRVAGGEPRSEGVSAAKGGGTPPSYLGCHHCGHRETMPQKCPSCHAEHDKLAACGPGVERIAEEARAMFADVEGTEKPTLAVLSSDESIALETWNQIEKGEVDILVGTQMVAKGHHFPRLTFVVVVDADVGLSGADLRAGERSYQLLHQLAGRAGRGELAGKVFIQTYELDHPVMKSLCAHDRDKLMALEAKERKAGAWPPFGQLAAILLDGVNEANVRAAGQQLAKSAPADERLTVLGPAPAPLSKLRGQYRYRLLVKAAPGIHLQRTLRNWLSAQKFSGVRIKIDVNPYYFM